DKDAVNSAMLISEMTGHYKKQGKTLLDVLDDLYEEYGYYATNVISIVLEGLDGQERIGRIMASVRKNPLEELAGLKVEKIVDYLNDDTGLSKSNVLKYYFTDKSWFSLRPSGTEPKIKLYVNAIGSSEEESQDKLKQIVKEMREVIDGVE